MSFYAADGSMNVTVVDASNKRGVYAADGSINVSTNGTFGAYDPTGAWRVNLATTDKQFARDETGALHITTVGSKSARPVTFVSGSLSPPPGGYVPTFFLLGF